jgi:hypothetical protein
MQNKFVRSVSFAIGLLAMLAINATAKNGPYGDNIFCWFSDVTENPRTNTTNNALTRLSGTGGIKVNAELTGGSTFRMGHYDVTIDGSGIASGGISSVNVDHDFNAAVSTAYFVAKSAVCTLPLASNTAGKEVLVWNACPTGGIITYGTSDSQLISGKQPSNFSNSTSYKLDRFMSDGSNWYKE